MWLEEWQGKQVLAQLGVAVPQGITVNSAPEAARAAGALGGLVMVKAQGPFGARGKAGLVRVARSPAEAEAIAGDLLSREHEGRRVRRVLVEQRVELQLEAYLGIAVDTVAGRPVLLASPSGGVDVEANRETVARAALVPGEPLSLAVVRGLLADAGFHEASAAPLADVAARLHEAFVATGAELVEVNPLGLTASGQWVALDARLVVEPALALRRPGFAAILDEAEPPHEGAAGAEEASYWELAGDVAYLTSGAGVALVLHDAITQLGARPANFFDPGFSMGQGKTQRLMDLLLRRAHEDPGVRAVIVALYIGGAAPEEVASGVANAIRERRPSVPIFGVTGGRGANTMARILADAGVAIQPGLREVVQAACAAARGESYGHPA